MASSRASGVRRMVSGLLLLLLCAQQPLHAFGVHDSGAPHSPASTTSPTATRSPTATLSPTAITTAPSTAPSNAPSANPTSSPTSSPTATRAPSATPTTSPTSSPTVTTTSPTTAPTDSPTTYSPTTTRAPSVSPTLNPTGSPTTSLAPSTTPTNSPTSPPTSAPTASPTTAAPSVTPTSSPTSSAPTTAPSAAPSASPSAAPSDSPSASPSAAPSLSPTVAPTAAPSAAPSESPSTTAPTTSPTRSPTTVSPTTLSPTTVSPTTQSPTTAAPTTSPTASPTASPTTAAPTPDVDECAEGTDDCDANAICANVYGVGKFLCTCDAANAYFGDGKQCSRFDIPVGFNVLSRVTFPQLEISMFESQSFNERFRSDFIAAMAAEGALVQPGISTRHPLIHRIMSGSVVVESSLGFDTEQSAQIFQARVDGAPREVFKKMAAYGDIISDSATYQVLNSDYVVPSDDKTEWYEEAGFFWSAVALGLALFLCCCFGGVMYCWNWSKANLGDDYRDKPADHDGGIFDSLPACPACPTSLSTCFGLLDKKDQKGRAINYQTATYGSDAAEDADEERDVEHGEAGGFDNPWADEPPAAQDWAPKGHATSNPFADFQMHDNPLADGGQASPPAALSGGGGGSGDARGPEPPMKPLTQFTEEEVEALLVYIGIDPAPFSELNITGEIMAELEDDDFTEELGVSPHHMVQLRAAMAERGVTLQGDAGDDEEI